MEQVKRAVQKLICRFGTNDPTEICDQLGLMICYRPLGKMKGITFNIDGEKVISINSLSPLPLQKVALAHELGHAVLHDHFGYYFLIENTYFYPNRFEREANYFAIELLLGDVRPIPGETVQQFAQRAGVQKEILLSLGYAEGVRFQLI